MPASQAGRRRFESGRPLCAKICFISASVSFHNLRFILSVAVRSCPGGWHPHPTAVSLTWRGRNGKLGRVGIWLKTKEFQTGPETFLGPGTCIYARVLRALVQLWTL